MSDFINVYWSICSSKEKETEQNLYMGELEPILPDLMKNKNNFYHKCKSFHDMFKNTFFIRHPQDLYLNFSDPTLKTLESEQWFANNLILFRKYSDHGTISFDYDHSLIFFAEEPITIQLLPAYMHNTEDKKFGHIAAGSMDISKWYRPIFPAYQLWDGIEEINFIKNDPMFYVNFITDKKIRLVRYQENDSLREIRKGCTDFKQVIPNQPLSELYRRFILSKTNKKVIKEIRNNIL